MKPLHINIEEDTLKNDNYRKVIQTTPYNQVVLMSIPPLEDISKEIHNDVSQFIRIEAGEGKAIIDGKEYSLSDGIALNIPNGLYHQIINTSSTEPLKLYSIYSPVEHPDLLVQKDKPINKNNKNILLLLSLM